jgi:hypothetical protein
MDRPVVVGAWRERLRPVQELNLRVAVGCSFWDDRALEPPNLRNQRHRVRCASVVTVSRDVFNLAQTEMVPRNASHQ